MINLVNKQNAMPEQAPDVRNKNFLEVCTGYTEDMAEQFVKDFNGYLEDFNEESELPYLVKASVGYCLLESEKKRDLEDCVNAADGKLYEYKRDKKKKKLDNVLREMEG